jgi:hypothetical protein
VRELIPSLLLTGPLTRVSISHPTAPTLAAQSPCSVTVVWAAVALKSPAKIRALQYLRPCGPRRTACPSGSGNGTPSSRFNLPDRLNPDWCRLRTGGTEILPGHDARACVPLPGLAGTITSCTGPSYRPRGTPWISASCGAKEVGCERWSLLSTWGVAPCLLCTPTLTAQECQAPLQWRSPCCCTHAFLLWLLPAHTVACMCAHSPCHCYTPVHLSPPGSSPHIYPAAPQLEDHAQRRPPAQKSHLGLETGPKNGPEEALR